MICVLISLEDEIINIYYISRRFLEASSVGQSSSESGAEGQSCNSPPGAKRQLGVKKANLVSSRTHRTLRVSSDTSKSFSFISHSCSIADCSIKYCGQK